jgi:hypothetical protein
MTAIDEIMAAFEASLNERDEQERRRFAELAVADDFVFTGISAQVESREAFVDLMGTVHKKYPPGTQIVRSSAVDVHHGRLRYAWEGRMADGSARSSGEHFGELGPDGRLKSVTVFDGSPSSSTKTT